MTPLRKQTLKTAQIILNRTVSYRLMKPLNIIFLLLLLLTACSSTSAEPAANAAAMAVPPTTEPVAVEAATPPAQPTETATADLSALLSNLTYSGILPDQTITLTEGVGNYDDDSIGQPYVVLVDHLIATGDLDSDGTEDAAAFLVDNSSGSADFVYLVAVLDIHSDPRPLEATQIGDRTPVKSLAIAEHQIISEFIGPGPGDVACCPSYHHRQVLKLQDGRLTIVSSDELGQATQADLQGSNWHLLDLNQGQEPLLPDSEITLSFDRDQVSGLSGCNEYNGSFDQGEDGLPQSLTIGPLTSTQKSCSAALDQQETDYLAKLADVITWRYDFGHLSLTYSQGDDRLGELVYSQPQ